MIASPDIMDLSIKFAMAFVATVAAMLFVDFVRHRLGWQQYLQGGKRRLEWVVFRAALITKLPIERNGITIDNLTRGQFLLHNVGRNNVKEEIQPLQYRLPGPVLVCVGESSTVAISVNSDDKCVVDITLGRSGIDPGVKCRIDILYSDNKPSPRRELEGHASGNIKIKTRYIGCSESEYSAIKRWLWRLNLVGLVFAGCAVVLEANLMLEGVLGFIVIVLLWMFLSYGLAFALRFIAVRSIFMRTTERI